MATPNCTPQSVNIPPGSSQQVGIDIYNPNSFWVALKSVTNFSSSGYPNFVAWIVSSLPIHIPPYSHASLLVEIQLSDKASGTAYITGNGNFDNGTSCYLYIQVTAQGCNCLCTSNSTYDQYDSSILNWVSYWQSNPSLHGYYLPAGDSTHGGFWTKSSLAPNGIYVPNVWLGAHWLIKGQIAQETVFVNGTCTWNSYCQANDCGLMQIDTGKCQEQAISYCNCYSWQMQWDADCNIKVGTEIVSDIIENGSWFYNLNKYAGHSGYNTAVFANAYILVSMHYNTQCCPSCQ
jgi:hypothetical protein